MSRESRRLVALAWIIGIILSVWVLGFSMGYYTAADKARQMILEVK